MIISLNMADVCFVGAETGLGLERYVNSDRLPLFLLGSHARLSRSTLTRCTWMSDKPASFAVPDKQESMKYSRDVRVCQEVRPKAFLR